MQTFQVTNIRWDILPDDLKWDSQQPQDEYTVSFKGLTKKDNIRGLIDDFLFYHTAYHNFGFDFELIGETPDDTDTFEIWTVTPKGKVIQIS